MSGGERAPSGRPLVERLRGLAAGPVGRLTAGTAAGQVFGLLVSPITARVFTPAESGAAGVFITLLSIPVALASLRFDAAILAPEHRTERSALLRLSLVVVPIVAAVSFLLLLVFRQNVASWFDEPRLLDFIWFTPLVVVALGAYQALAAWASRERMFAELAAIPVRRSIQQLGFQLGVGTVVGGSAWVLVVGHVIGGAAGSVQLWRRMRERVRQDWAQGATRLGDVARRYRDFPFLNGAGTLLNYAGAGLPLLAVGALHGSTSAGLYRWAQLLVWIPITALVNAIGSVYSSHIAALRHTDVVALQAHRRRMTRRLFGLATAVSVGALALPYMVPFVFGARWAESGTLALLSMPAIVLSIVTTPTGALPLMGRNDLQLAWEGTRVGLMIAAFVYCNVTNTTLRGTTVVFMCALALGYLLHWLANELVTRRLVAGATRG